MVHRNALCAPPGVFPSGLEPHASGNAGACPHFVSELVVSIHSRILLSSRLRVWSEITALPNDLLRDFSFLDESARWLMGAARYSEAREILVRIAKIRGDVSESRVDEMIEIIKKKDAEVLNNHILPALATDVKYPISVTDRQIDSVFRVSSKPSPPWPTCSLRRTDSLPWFSAS